MRPRLGRRGPTLAVLGLVGLAFAGCQILAPAALTAQPSAAQPPIAGINNNVCRAWDDGFAALFDGTFVACVVASLVLGPFLGPLGRRFWFFTAVRRRTIASSLAVLVLAIVSVPLAPWTVGLGRWWLAGVDPAYPQCTNLSFGAGGLLFGLVSPGQAAISQWPVMILLLIAGVVVGSLIAILAQRLFNRFLGIRSRLVGGEE
jgi:hypothetical protein